MITQTQIQQAAAAHTQPIYADNPQINNGILEDVFHAGIDWYLNTLWHDASEVPNRAAAQILLEQDFYDTRQYQVYIFNGSSFFRDVVDGCHILRWLYIDDLLKGSK